MIENVETLDDPRLDAFARLTEAQLRSKLEPEKALFIAESGKVIERALAAGMEPLSLLMEANAERGASRCWKTSRTTRTSAPSSARPQPSASTPCW